MNINSYFKTYHLLKEADRLHNRARINLDYAKIIYAGKPYSSEAFFDVVIADAEHRKALFYLHIIENESESLKSEVIADIRKRIGISSQTFPDPLASRTFSELVDILVVLLANYIRPSTLTKLVNLLIDGELSTISELVNDTTITIRDIMRDALGDPNFGTTKTLSQLWNDPQNYIYDRIGAAQCGMARSRRNFAEKDGNGDYVFPSDNTTPPINVGGFNYNTLNHSSATGSAYYISEMLFHGGNLPMRNCATTEPGCDQLDLSELDK